MTIRAARTPPLIRAAVMEGCPDATEVGDRAEAILRGCRRAGAR